MKGRGKGKGRQARASKSASPRANASKGAARSRSPRAGTDGSPVAARRVPAGPRLRKVNRLLEFKVSELESANQDLANLFASNDVATILLDRQLHIRRFTPATRRLLQVCDSDLGRPLADLATNFTDERLRSDAGVVLVTLVPIEREVNDAEGRWYLRRVVPYRRDDDRVDGVVIMFTDITAHKANEDALQRLNDRLERRIGQRTAEVRRLIESAPDATLVVGRNGAILEANQRAEVLFDFPHGTLTGKPIETLMPERFRAGFRRERIRGRCPAHSHGDERRGGDRRSDPRRDEPEAGRGDPRTARRRDRSQHGRDGDDRARRADRDMESRRGATLRVRARRGGRAEVRHPVPGGARQRI
jgi:PAS domain-containing protein